MVCPPSPSVKENVRIFNITAGKVEVFHEKEILVSLLKEKKKKEKKRRKR